MRKEPLPDHYLLLAPFYEFFSNKVFGTDFQRSKKAFLDRIKEGDTVLVLGGGTGTILPPILKQIGKSGRIIYLEASGTMIQRSQQQVDLASFGQIQWLHSSRFEDLPLIKLDAIISHYFLDALPDQSIDRLFQEMKERIHSETDWIFTDFFPKASRKRLLWGMITLFRILTRHPRKNLPDYPTFFQKWGWEKVDFVPFQQGFFQSVRYKPAPKSINSPITSLK